MSNDDFEKNVDLKTYIEHKIDMLEDEFFIHLSLYECQRFRSLTNETQVDNYAHSILVNRL